MTGGSSGGRGSPAHSTINSVNSFGYHGLSNAMFGPYFGSADPVGLQHRGDPLAGAGCSAGIAGPVAASDPGRSPTRLPAPGEIRGEGGPRPTAAPDALGRLPRRPAGPPASAASSRKPCRHQTAPAAPGPPVPAAEQPHGGRHEQRPDERRVDQDRDDHADPDHLDEDDPGGRERADHHDQQQRRAGDDPAGALQAGRHRARCCRRCGPTARGSGDSRKTS